MTASLRALLGMQALGLLPPTAARRARLLALMLRYPHPWNRQSPQ